MKLIADTHTHTLACDHAYSTLAENIQAAKRKGLLFLAMTEHTPSMPGGPSRLHFTNLRILPQSMDGVSLLKGAEVNIMDREGALDLTDSILEKLDWVIASLHLTNYKPATRRDHTATWLAIAENPLVDVIGHCGDGRYAFDHEPVIDAFAKHEKIVEINAHSFLARPGSRENCPRIARLCAEKGVSVVVSSDAHHSSKIGHFSAAVKMLQEIDFPRELILNADADRFLAAAQKRAVGKTQAYLEELGRQRGDE